jgi:hypothetical protein
LKLSTAPQCRQPDSVPPRPFQVRNNFRTVFVRPVLSFRAEIEKGLVLAEREGFEPSKGVNPYTLSRDVFASTAIHPSLTFLLFYRGFVYRRQWVYA